MDAAQHTKIVTFIWSIADDVLRDVYVRGKYRDVILPMTVIRRLDAVLEPTKDDVKAVAKSLSNAGILNVDGPLRHASGQAFYNTSPFRLRDLLDTPLQLKVNFIAYLDGFSPNIREILEKFEFRNQLDRLAAADRLGDLVRKFIDPRINLSPNPVGGQPGLDNHAMGTIFEELIRRFNEENNEEAGEHFTPRDIVTLMTHLIFEPIAGQINNGLYRIYDGACGSGGMLSVAEETLQELAAKHGKTVQTQLSGQEINAETYAICKADMILKGEGENADNIFLASTLASDQLANQTFDFMLSNPPYGKAWGSDLDKMGGKKSVRDNRFVVTHAGDPEYSLVTRTSDGQMMFLVNKLAKMKKDTLLGSRIAEVHNGSALFTGDAGQGESNIRRWIIENDWLEAIIALPTNIFYNTGIATYVWLLTNRKPEHRKGKVQLIDATAWHHPLRKNLGQRNREMTAEDIQRVLESHAKFEETEQSKIFPNEAFGYRKVTVERPLRLSVEFSAERIARLRESGADDGLAAAAEGIARAFGAGPHLDYMTVAMSLGTKLTSKREKLLREHFCDRNDEASPIIVKDFGEADDWNPSLLDPADRLTGMTIDYWRLPFGMIGQSPFPIKVHYEPDPELRDTEQIPLLENGGILGFMEREVWPHVPDAWADLKSEKIGYEVSFTRYYFNPKPLRTLEQIGADIISLEKESEGLLDQILGLANE